VKNNKVKGIGCFPWANVREEKPISPKRFLGEGGCEKTAKVAEARGRLAPHLSGRIELKKRSEKES